MQTEIGIRARLKVWIISARKQGRPHIEVNAAEFHRQLGGYPAKRGHPETNQMLMVVKAMRHELECSEAEIIHSVPRKLEAFTVRYKFRKAPG